jgi:predicted phage terminase large subunit-like protein
VSSLHRINPLTGKRRDWEAKQKATQDDTIEIKRQLAALERAARAEQARNDLLAFTQFTMPDPEAMNDITRSRYVAKQFHKEVAKVLERVESGEITQLIFCVPPRHGKTEMATKRFAAWYSGKHPDHDIAVASYSDTMAEDMGADTRAILNSAQYKQVFPKYSLRRGGSAKSNIQSSVGGRLVFVGRGGALTGRGANLLLVDDIFKDHEEARSQTIRDQAWNWFTKVAMTRRMGKKLVVITMTRWHSDDIIGRLTDPENQHYSAEEAASWKIIRLPALAEEDDPLGRPVGEPLWPENYGTEYLRQQQRIDPLGFAALFQQRPTVADGILFRRENIRYYDTLPENLRYYASSDHAVGTKERNDPSCFLKVGIDEDSNIYLTETAWKRMAADEQVEVMLTMATGKTAPLQWWAERGHISKSIGPFLHKRAQETGRYINVVEVTPAVDKEQRAQSIAARVAMGKVFFPRVSTWTEKAVNELLAFPNGNHDDFVDALAYIGLGLQNQFAASGPRKVEKAPAFGTLAWVREHEKHAERDALRRRASGGF